MRLGLRIYVVAIVYTTMSFTDGLYDEFFLIEYKDIFEIPKKRAIKLMQQHSTLKSDKQQVRLKYDALYRSARKHCGYYRRQDALDAELGQPHMNGCDDDDDDPWVLNMINQRHRLLIEYTRQQERIHFTEMREQHAKKKMIDESNEEAFEYNRRRQIERVAAKWEE